MIYSLDFGIKFERRFEVNMRADFSPTLGTYSGQGAFRYWCQSVLPLTFDDSLSYMELLNKVVVYLNNMREDVATAEDNITALANAYNQLEDYVNTYFDNLDINEAIEYVLDKWTTDGRLGDIVEPYVVEQVTEQIGDTVAAQLADVVASQISAVVAQQIGDTVAGQLSPVVAQQVTAWLNENVDPVGSAVVVDSTLSISGAAADAKVVGNDIEDIKTDCSLTTKRITTNFDEIRNVSDTNVVSLYDLQYDIENEYYSTTYNEYVRVAGKHSIRNIPIEPNTTYYTVSDGIIFFDSSHEFIEGVTSTHNIQTEVLTPNNAAYCDLLIFDDDIPWKTTPGTITNYLVSKINGTQSRIITHDSPIFTGRPTAPTPEYGANDDEVATARYADRAANSPNKLSACGYADNYGNIIDINKCTLTPTNVKISPSSINRFSDHSIKVDVTKIEGVNTYSLEIVLPSPITTKNWNIIMMYTDEMLNASTGIIITGRINNSSNTMFASNQNNQISDYWLTTQLAHHGSAQTISKFVLSITLRPGMNVGDTVSFFIDSIMYDFKMKPCFILNFDQWWDESITNGGYDYLFDNDVPFTMMTKNYDSLASNYMQLADKVEKYKYENAYYASYGSDNNSLFNSTTYPNANTEVQNMINDYENAFKHNVVSYGATQMKLAKLDRSALLNNGFKMIRAKGQGNFIDYFDEFSWWTPSTGISHNEMTIAQIKARIDHIISYGGCFLAFTHGINADGADYMSGTSSVGINITDFKSMIDYLVTKRANGEIDILTMRDWYNNCVK